MKKFLKTTVFIILIFALVFTLFGCKSNSGGKESSATENKNGSVKIEDINWNVEAGIVDGKREVALEYTNNSDYTISEMKIKFKEKESITEEQKEKYIGDLKETFGFDESDEEDKKGLEELKAKKIEMTAKLEKIVKPGETAIGGKVTYYDGYYHVNDIGHYDLVEPDIATIVFVKDGSVYTEYYDFFSKKYSLDSDVKLAQYWSSGTFGGEIPKPQAEIVECELDIETGFSFNVFGWTAENFNSYVESCKGMGYTLNSSQDDEFYSADNEKGYNVCLYYNQEKSSANISVSLSEKS